MENKVELLPQEQEVLSTLMNQLNLEMVEKFLRKSPTATAEENKVWWEERKAICLKQADRCEKEDEFLQWSHLANLYAILGLED